MEKKETTLKYKYPAKQHAKSVVEILKKKIDPNKKIGIFIRGEINQKYDHTDLNIDFRQNRYFYYITGCNLDGSYVFYDGVLDELILYLKKRDIGDNVWIGETITLDEAKMKYNVDKVKYECDLESDLSLFVEKHNLKVYSTYIDETKSYSKNFKKKNNELFSALKESRLIKSTYEIDLMRKALKITDECHLFVMRNAFKIKNESDMHALFIYKALEMKAKIQAYSPIFAAGKNCSILHYTKNDSPIDRDTNTALIDAGVEWECYASDVTRSFPLNGIWTKEHLEIYELVRKMQRDTILLMKPDVYWEDLHLTAHKILIEGFLRLNIFKSNFSISEILSSNVSYFFYPHGLGHLIGLDVHDVFDFSNPQNDNLLLKFLRFNGPLKKGMVITNEPGIYFNSSLLKEMLNSTLTKKFINHETLLNYVKIGGVRIEDVVLITHNGFDVLSNVTSDPHEISNIILNNT